MEVGSIFRQILAQMGTEDFRKALNSKKFANRIFQLALPVTLARAG